MILLITCFPWDARYGGAFILRKLVGGLRDEKLHWFSISEPSNGVGLPLGGVSFEYRSAPNFGNVRLGLGRFWGWYKRSLWGPGVARELRRWIGKHRPKLVWLVADYGLAPIALRLLPTLRGTRFHISLHDDLETTAERERVSEAFLREIRAFLTDLRGMDFTADAVSEELLEACAPTAREAGIVTMPVDPTTCVRQFRPPRSTGRLEIGFSGNFFGIQEIRCFVEALKTWSVQASRDWRLQTFGCERMKDLDSRIDAHGYTESGEVRQALMGCDLLLLPSPLDRPEMRTNMPTKLVTYLELGKMVLAFAPAGSSTERVLVEANLGPVITNLSKQDSALAIQRAFNWDYAAAEKGWNNLLAGRFNEERILGDLRRLLRS